MSQMFLPFFLSLFYQALQKRHLHLLLSRNRQQEFLAANRKKCAYCVAVSTPCNFRGVMPPSRWNHPDILKERKQEIPRRSFFGVALTMQPKKKSYICAIKNGRSNVQKKNQKLAHST